MKGQGWGGEGITILESQHKEKSITITIIKVHHLMNIWKTIKKENFAYKLLK